MKIYKHKKTGNIAQETHSAKNYRVTAPQSFTIPKWIVEDGGDWELVSNSDFEILTFYCPESEKYADLQKNGNYFNSREFAEPLFGGAKVSDLLNSKSHTICSVRRLSDGQIFSVGDYFRAMGRKYKITSFRMGIVNDGLYADGQAKNGDQYSGYDIKHLQKIDGPLFTTHDGQPIYYADEYYIVYPQYTTSWVSQAVDKMHGALATFSTKELAEAWILMNKPCLSITDIIKVGHQSTLHLMNFDELVNKLKVLVKSNYER